MLKKPIIPEGNLRPRRVKREYVIVVVKTAATKAELHLFRPAVRNNRIKVTNVTMRYPNISRKNA